jgi:hypothetical protein
MPTHDQAIVDYDAALARNPRQPGSLYGRGLGVKVIPKVAAPSSRRQRRSTPAFPKNFAAMGLANDRGRKYALLSRTGTA